MKISLTYPYTIRGHINVQFYFNKSSLGTIKSSMIFENVWKKIFELVC